MKSTTLTALLAWLLVSNGPHAQACANVDRSPIDVSELAACVAELGREIERLKRRDTGMIAAFPGECPTAAGWTPYNEAVGRMIVGVGDLDDGQEERSFIAGETNGKFRHKLEVVEMPAHSHPGSKMPDDPYFRTNNGQPDSEVAQKGNDWKMQATGGLELKIAEQGESKPHNNMPPYIALYFCKKEG